MLLIEDFNLDTLSKTKTTNSYASILNRHKFTNLIKTATRITSASQTLIDHAIVKSAFAKHYVIEKNELEITDHQPIIILLKIPLKVQSNSTSLTALKRLFRESEKEAFKNEIEKIDWSFTTYENNVNVNFYTFFILLNNAYVNSFPEHKISNGKIFKTKWMNHQLLSLVVQKRKLYVKKMRYPTQENILELSDSKQRHQCWKVVGDQRLTKVKCTMTKVHVLACSTMSPHHLVFLFHEFKRPGSLSKADIDFGDVRKFCSQP